MIIGDEALNKIYSDVVFETHERVPFFIVDSDSVVTINEVEYNVIDNYYTKIIEDVTYAKMNSTHKNFDGTFSGAEPTYSGEVPAEWSELGSAISATTMLKIEGVANMETEERIAYEIEELRKAKNDVAFELIVMSEAYGTSVEYTINLKIWNELQTQYLTNGKVAFHDNSKTMHDMYTAEQSDILMNDIGKAVAFREAKYDVWITRASYGVYDVSEIFSEQEQLYINAIVAGV